MANFDNCQFGPLALRALFRERLLPGERIIGWSVAARQARSFDVAMVIFMSMIPIVGSFITVAYAGRFRRLIILTDTRLIMLDPSADPRNVRKRKPLLDVPLHAVVVANTKKKNKFRVGAPGLGGVEIYTFQNERPSTTKRLVAGLKLLAADTDSAGRLIDNRSFGSELNQP